MTPNARQVAPDNFPFFWSKHSRNLLMPFNIEFTNRAGFTNVGRDLNLSLSLSVV